MTIRERDWLLGLGAAAVLVAGLTLGPVAFPRPRVPTVTHTTLPATPDAGGQPPTYPATPSVTPLISGRLNLNTATEEQLEALPKVGPSLAGRLIAARPYHSLNDLDNVRGVGEATLKRLAPLVTW